MFRSIAALLFGALCLPAQQVLVVDVNGPGPYRTIQSGVDAANPGDTVLVRAGLYDGFRVNKGIGVVAGSGVTLRPTSRTAGPVIVESVPRGQRASIRGFQIITLSVHSSPGPVHIEDVTIGSFFSSFFVSTSQQVTVHRLTCGTITQISNSSVVCTQCRFGTTTLDNSTVTFAESVCDATGVLPAMTSNYTRLTIAGGSQTIIKSNSAFPSAPLDALATTGGTVDIDPQVTLVPANGGLPISGTALVTTRTLPSLTALLTTTSLSLRLRAPGALRGHTLIGLPISGPVALPFGDLWLADHIVLDTGSMPGNGERNAVVALPPLPSGLPVVLQALIAQPSGLQLSTPVITITP